MNHRDRIHSRTFTTAIALLLVFVLLISGTYALSISETNIRAANLLPATGRLHDDYEAIGGQFGANHWDQGISGNKNIYVENYGDSTQGDIFVRIRLYEYMEVGRGAKLQPGEEGFEDRLATSILPNSQREVPETWYPYLPGSDTPSSLFREYWSWQFGGEKFYMPTFNQDPMSLEPDVKGDGVMMGSLQLHELPNSTGRNQAYAYPAQAGSRGFFEEKPIHMAQVKYWDGNNHAITPNLIAHTARPTLEAQVVQMKDWNKTLGEMWVMDEDGWAYWATPLSPETATGLLLSSITLVNKPYEEWYYAIYAEAQMATADNWKDVFYDDLRKVPSSQGEELMEIITAKPDNNPGRDTPLGGTFKDSNGNLWRVLAIDEGGRKLIITEQIHGLGTMYHHPNSYVRLQDTSHLRPALNDWYENNLGPELQERALTALNLENDVRSVPEPGPLWDWDIENASSGWTSAGGEASRAEEALFVLSISEVNRYSGAGTLNRIATAHQGGVAARSWWLRSPGTGSVGPATSVREAGNILQINSTGSGGQVTHHGFRPAMWITVEEWK